jgi:O-antigen/teichoic acid export membrane protein
MSLTNLKTPFYKNQHEADIIPDRIGAEQRSRERYRRVILTGLSSGFNRLSSILTIVISISLTFRHLGTEKFGLWMTITSLITMQQFMDFGVGNGLVNAVSRANGRGDKKASRVYISSGFFFLATISVFLIFLLLSFYKYFPWNRIYNLDSAVGTFAVGPATAAFLIFILLSIPLGIIQRVQIGYQEGYINDIWQTVGSVFGLLGIFFAVKFQADLLGLVLGLFGGQLLGIILNWIFYFGFYKNGFYPTPKLVEINAVKKIGQSGFLFFILQLACVLSYSADNFIITQVLGVQFVTDYSIAQKMFLIGPVIQTLFVAPLWPAYGEALVRNDCHWIKKTFWKSFYGSIAICIIFSLLLIPLGNILAKGWLGKEIDLPTNLLIGFGLWAILSGYMSATTMFLNGVGKLKVQILAFLGFGVFSIFLKVILARIFGAPGVIFATVIAFVIFLAFPLIFYVCKTLDSFNYKESTLSLGLSHEVSK